MKIFFLIISLFAGLLLLSEAAATDNEKWMLIVQSKAGDNYYIDANSLHYRPGNTALAWYKLVDNKKSASYSRTKNIDIFGKSFTEYEHTKILCEIGCSTGKLRTLTISAYDSTGEVIHRDETLNGSWVTIPAGSCFEAIRNIVCKR